MKLLQDIKQCRTTFDTSDTRRSFGPIVVDYTKVQSKVSLKYDSWHKDVLSKFGQLLGQEMTQFHAQVSWRLYSITCAFVASCKHYIDDSAVLKASSYRQIENTIQAGMS